MVKKEITQEQRQKYKQNFINKKFNGNIDEYKKYLSNCVLRTYYNNKLLNPDEPKRKIGRPRKLVKEIIDCKTDLKNQEIKYALSILLKYNNSLF